MYRLEYYPLVLCKDNPYQLDDSNFTLKKHVADPSDPDYSRDNDKGLDEESIIAITKFPENRPLLLICITMYNEHPKQLLQSLAGVYRAYYELISNDFKNINKVQVIIIIDGYKDIEEEYLNIYEKAGIYNAFCTVDYKYSQLSADK